MLTEKFGDPIDDVFGTKVGDVKDIKVVGAVGVRGKENPMLEVDVCPGCGMMPINGQCGCEQSEVCPTCGMMPPAIEAPCSCGMNEGLQTCGKCGMSEATCECGGGMYEAEEDGPSPAVAKKILRGTKTFKEKMKKVSSWAEDPAAAAAWMMHRATGKWPSEK